MGVFGKILRERKAQQRQKRPREEAKNAKTVEKEQGKAPVLMVGGVRENMWVIVRVRGRGGKRCGRKGGPDWIGLTFK